MPTKITLPNGTKKVVLKEEEEKLLCQLMGELSLINADFLITKMVIYGWPKADTIGTKSGVNGTTTTGGDVKEDAEDVKESKESKESSSSSEDIKEARYMNRLLKWRNCMITDDFCYRYCTGSCFQQDKKKECKSLMNIVRKHDKSFNIEQLYNNGDTTIKNKRRAYYLAHYLRDYNNIQNNVINKFMQDIENDKHWYLINISYENTSLSKKEKRMRRKINKKNNYNNNRYNNKNNKNKNNKGVVKGGKVGNVKTVNNNKSTKRNDGHGLKKGLNVDNNNNILSSLMEVEGMQPLDECIEDNKLSSVGLTSSSGDISNISGNSGLLSSSTNNQYEEESSVITGSGNSVTNAYITTDDIIDSNGDNTY